MGTAVRRGTAAEAAGGAGAMLRGEQGCPPGCSGSAAVPARCGAPQGAAAARRWPLCLPHAAVPGCARTEGSAAARPWLAVPAPEKRSPVLRGGRIFWALLFNAGFPGDCRRALTRGSGKPSLLAFPTASGGACCVVYAPEELPAVAEGLSRAPRRSPELESGQRASTRAVVGEHGESRTRGLCLFGEAGCCRGGGKKVSGEYCVPRSGGTNPPALNREAASGNLQWRRAPGWNAVITSGMRWFRFHKSAAFPEV